MVSCELLPGRPGQGCWQPMKARQAGLCSRVSSPRPQRHGSYPDRGRVAGRRARSGTTPVSPSFSLHSAQTNKRPMRLRLEAFNRDAIDFLAICGLNASRSLTRCISLICTHCLFFFGDRNVHNVKKTLQFRVSQSGGERHRRTHCSSADGRCSAALTCSEKNASLS